MELPGYYGGKAGDTYVDSYDKHHHQPSDKQGFLKGLLGGKDEAKKSASKAGAPSSPSVPKKFMDMISPLLLGSSGSSAANSPAAHAQQQQHGKSPTTSGVSAFAKAAAAIHGAGSGELPSAAASMQHSGSADSTSSDAQNMMRAPSYNSGLTEYVNKMKISEQAAVAAAAAVGPGGVPGTPGGGSGAATPNGGKRSKLSNESTLSSSSSMSVASAMSMQSIRSAGAPAAPMPHLPGVPAGQQQQHAHALAHHHHHHMSTPQPQQPQGPALHHPPMSASHQHGAPLNPHSYTSNLDRLLEAARYCQLPQSGRPLQPMPADPMANPHLGPTIPLVVSPNLPPRMQRSQWRLSDYSLGDKLYTGYASTVYKAVCRASGEVVVLKIYHLMSVCDLYKYQIYREVRVHSNLCHENIVHLYAAFQEGDKVILVQEYADGQDLFSMLHKYGGRLSERLAVQLVLEPFLRVLQYLHSRAIIHRDIKPENILFNKASCLKLGDFGLAIDLREERAVTRAGTLDYMAPEVLRCPFKSRPEENKDNERLHYSARVDAWAVGVLTYELLVGFPPFFDQSRTSTEDRIVHSMPAFPAGLSDEAKAFVSAALSKHAAERPTILEMLHHPWIARYSARRSMRVIAPSSVNPAAAAASPAPSPLASPSTATPRRPAPPANASMLQSAASLMHMPGSQPVTPVRPPPPVAAGGYPTLGSVLSSMDKQAAAHVAHGHGHHLAMGHGHGHAMLAPPSPQSPLVFKSSNDSHHESHLVAPGRFSGASSSASMQM